MNCQLMTVKGFLSTYRRGHSEFYRQVNTGKLRLTKIGNAIRVVSIYLFLGSG